jgi:hypothetical protein
MSLEVVSGRRRRAVLVSILFVGLSTFGPSCALAVNSLTIGWDPSLDAQVIGYKVYYGTASGSYTNVVAVSNSTIATISNLVDGATYFLAATAVDAMGLESAFSNEAVFTNAITPPPNQPPTLNSLVNLIINENAGLQTINLSGITSGAANGVQALSVTAVSSNPGLIPNPVVSYSSPASTGSLSFTPVAKAYGTAAITVTVNDGGASNNLVTQSFTVTVNPVNQPPTLNAVSNFTINENAGLQTVNLSGITSGASNEVQTLSVTAASSSPGLIPNPVVSYSSPASTGSLSFTPVANAYGTATLTVTVNDGGASNNLVTQSFTITVNAVNQPPTLNSLANLTINENVGLQTINLSGITSGAANGVQTLSVTAVSSNPGLIPNPLVSYSSPASTGSLSFTPVAKAYGTAAITVTVNDGAASNNLVTQSLTVTVNPVNQPPTLNAVSNFTINENAGLQTVNLSGITSGASNEVQTLSITAVSSNPGLIPNPAVSYTSPASTGSLSFTPVAKAYGTAAITVTVNDGGASNNLVTQSFTITVNPVNQPPTLNALANFTINENAGLVTVNLSGITSGAANELQTLSVTAVSSSSGLIPNPVVSYSSPASTGSLSFTPVANAYGTAAITVTVNDGGASNNLVTQSFTVTVNAVNQPPTLNPLANVTIRENAGLQTVNLSGITSGAANEIQTLSVTAGSSNPALIPNPAVSYTSPALTGSLSFIPVANANGTATITVTVNDGGASNNLVTRSFMVVVNQLTISAIPNCVIGVGTHTQALPFTISDGETPAANLSLSGSSSNLALVQNADIVFAGSNTNRTVTVTPIAGQSGQANITVNVSDGLATNFTTFKLSVKPGPPGRFRVAGT